MQMRFDGLLGFPGGWVPLYAINTFWMNFKLLTNEPALFMKAVFCFIIRYVNPSETLEAGLSRELLEEVGVAVPVGVDNRVSSCLSPSCLRLITHFYIKKMTETELKEMERAAVATATDHGLEVKTLSIISWVCKCTYKILLCNYLICLQVLGMVRVPLYFLKNAGGLPYFLSHSFISNSRAQLLSALQRCRLLSQGEVEKAVRQAEQMRRTHRGDPHWHQLTQRCLFTPRPQLHHSSPTPSWFNQIQHVLSVDNLCLRGSDLFNIP